MPQTPDDHEDRVVHNLKNQLAIIIGFSDLMLSEMNANDPHFRDLNEVNKAGHAALAEVRTLAARQR
jgi:hypothetical protein